MEICVSSSISGQDQQIPEGKRNETGCAGRLATVKIAKNPRVRPQLMNRPANRGPTSSIYLFIYIQVSDSERGRKQVIAFLLVGWNRVGVDRRLRNVRWNDWKDSARPAKAKQQLQHRRRRPLSEKNGARTAGARHTFGHTHSVRVCCCSCCTGLFFRAACAQLVVHSCSWPAERELGTFPPTPENRWLGSSTCDNNYPDPVSNNRLLATTCYTHYAATTTPLSLCAIEYHFLAFYTNCQYHQKGLYIYFICIYPTQISPAK